MPALDEIIFKSGKTKQELLLFNPFENKNNYLLGIDILIYENNEKTSQSPEEVKVEDCKVIFSSKVLLHEEEIDTISLSQKLKRGTYDGFVRYRIFSPDDDVSPLTAHVEPTVIRVKQDLGLLWLVLVVLLLAGIASAVLWYYNDYNSKKHVSTNTVQFEREDTSSAVSENPGTVHMPVYRTETIPANQKTVPLTFYNPWSNEGFCYLEYTIKFEDTGEVLYTSDLIPPGETTTLVTLNQPLEAGTYQMVAEIKSYYMDDMQKPVGRNGGNHFKLEVQ